MDIGAASPGTLDELGLRFVSGASPQDRFRLLGVEGRERMSQLFSFELLISRDEPIDDELLEAMLHAPCAVALGPHHGDVVHGLLSELWAIDTTQSKTPRYLARLVPTLWLLGMSRNSRVFQHATVPDLVRQVLDGYSLQSPRDYRIFELEHSLEHEHVVQYQETDWDFLQRWLEHEGRFYWFEHGRDSEALVVADNNDEATPIVAPTRIAYRDRNNLWTGGERTVWDFDLHQKRVPARVVVTEYNYRNPALRLLARHDVDQETGFGTLIHHHEHFKTNEEGAVLAKLRAEKVQCQRRTFAGRSDCARFRVGHAFELIDHPIEERNGSYLITAVQHQAGFPVRDEREHGKEAPLRPYTCELECIPTSVPYRPPRRTPWPRINGIVTGHIAGDGDGSVAELDEMGRYKVRMSFDMARAKGGQVSRWIRMAQPYTGSGHGTHHPLRKGAEVLVAHVNGDPDRPIIVGAVPNAFTVGPTTHTNPTQSTTQTASGIRIEMEDSQS